jgi:hypothetical protein
VCIKVSLAAGMGEKCRISHHDMMRFKVADIEHGIWDCQPFTGNKHRTGLIWRDLLCGSARRQGHKHRVKDQVVVFKGSGL